MRIHCIMKNTDPRLTAHDSSPYSHLKEYIQSEYDTQHYRNTRASYPRRNTSLQGKEKGTLHHNTIRTSP